MESAKYSTKCKYLDDRTPSIAFIEPFNGGSHKVLADVICSGFNADCYSLPDKKWHWYVYK